MDGLGIVRENESPIETCYNEVITSVVKAESRWVTTSKGNRQKVQESPVTILTKTSICFWILFGGGEGRECPFRGEQQQ